MSGIENVYTSASLSRSREGQEYSYYPLNEDHIRLLVLMPGQQSSEDIFCELIHRNITREPPPYEALSWCWGSELLSSTILIRDHGRYLRHKVPESLATALMTLRYPSEERIIWVDAVCINQSHSEEKNVQVPLMSKIYGLASRVCVWLGTPDKDTALAISFIKEQILQLHNFDELCSSSDTTPQWGAVLQLMQRPWFSRRWVVQEIALSRDALIYCGLNQIRWRDFASAVELILQAESTGQKVSNVMRKDPKFQHVPALFEHVSALGASLLVDATRNMSRRSTDQVLEPVFTIEYLVAKMQAFDVTDPKDAIYSLLALAYDTLPVRSGAQQNEGILGRVLSIWGGAIKMKPYLVDYSQTYIETCRQFISFCIAKSEPTRALDILCRPWAPVLRIRDSSTTIPTEVGLPSRYLPSWIPQLSGAAYAMFQCPNSLSRMSRLNADSLVGVPGEKISYNASGTLPFQPHRFGFKKRESFYAMMVSGFILDEVEHVDAVSQNGHIPESWVKTGGWHDLTQGPPDQFWRTLVADRSSDGGNAPIYGARAVQLSITRGHFGGHLNTAELVNSPSSIVSHFFRRVQAVVWNKRIMQTKAGRVGLVRNDVRRGDIICILFGCSVPVILRRYQMSSEQLEREVQEHHAVLEQHLSEAVVLVERLWLRKMKRRTEGDPFARKPNKLSLGDVVQTAPTGDFYVFLGECYIHGMMDGEAIRFLNEHHTKTSIFELR